jgi:predicted ABC-type ATPase
MMARPELWLIAGPNGSGKTTLAQREPINDLIPGIRLVNPDDLTLRRLKSLGIQGFENAPPDVLQESFLWGAAEAEADIRRSVEICNPICVETVLSTKKYSPIISYVEQHGGFFGLIYVVLSSPELCIQRVANRVKDGGHDVPAEKIRSRWQRSLELLPHFASRATAFWVFDNSDARSELPPELIAYGFGGRLAFARSSESLPIQTALQSISGWDDAVKKYV